MGGEWKKEQLSALCAEIADCPHSTPLWTDSGALVLRSQNIRNGRLDLSAKSYTDEAHFEQRSRRARLRGGDLVITREAPMGEVCLIPDGLRCCLGQRMVMLRPDPKKCDSRFLLYAIQSRAVQDEIKVNEGTGSTVSNLRIPLLKALPIPLPPLAEQKAIAAVLGALDDKIELNRRMNATLEAMARALFQSWFVDFDPVRQNMDRNQPSPAASRHPLPVGEGRGEGAAGMDFDPVRAKLDGSNPVGLDSTTTALFPDSFDETELGHIPHGWEVKTLGEVIDLAYGKPLKAEDRKNGPVCVYGANGQIGWHDEKLVSGPGIVVGRKGNPGVVTWAHGDFYPIDTTFYVEPKGDCRSLYFLYYALSLHNLANLSADSAVPGLNRNHAYMSKQVIPSQPELAAFDSQIAPIFAAIHANEEQSCTLATLRDTLLPKLLSGALRILSNIKIKFE